MKKRLILRDKVSQITEKDVPRPTCVLGEVDIQDLGLQPLSRVRFEGAESGLVVYRRRAGSHYFGEKLEISLKIRSASIFRTSFEVRFCIMVLASRRKPWIFR